ncbi:U-box domain-containing protein 13-like isoform X2 [Impatiens glandulifera]|uniref:U-box domain-containing protein 13-like isoform X2 n=1 Tax=Impatiens glandulifera TaxID=253017 RepID=UPI001FB065B0|nr:U-box domain-containing protein 13-like isoform X2 [Impatiens glandulifera]
MEEEKGALAQNLVEIIDEISSISDFRSSVKRQFCNLARRLKLLTPMFEEIRDGKQSLPKESLEALSSLKESLESTRELLRFGSEGSRIYLVLKMEETMNRFQEITANLEQALGGIAYEKLDISDEVTEQVELVLAQFKRAKGRIDAPDVDLQEDLVSLYNKINDPSTTDPAVIKRVAEKLQLMGLDDLTQESIALHEMVYASDGDPGESMEKMSMLLKKVKDFVQTENPNFDASSRCKSSSPASCSGQASLDESNTSIFIPNDFRCPISLELMRDPVIVSSGQTYERSCIEQWLDQGHGTCPKTQQTLASTVLTPNYVLRSLIEQWCESNGIEPPKRPTNTSSTSSPEETNLEVLLRKLSSHSPEDQRSAAGEIRLLAKRNADNRIAIAEAGAIPFLVNLLSTPDSRTQEHAVTALLNLSICEDNKGSIVSSGAVPGIVHVLKKGSMEARENAAATLFSLSVIDDNKVTIGASGAIPPLVTLLSEGTQRGKKDAATALFNLCIFQGNKGKAIRAGVVPTLIRLLTEPQGGMVDEALAILAILSSHPEGKAIIGGAKALPILIDVIKNGSPRNKENSAAVLVHLCGGDQQQYMVEAQELGLMGPLHDLSQNGTDRGKRKAIQLLERINKFVEQPKGQNNNNNEVEAEIVNQEVAG